MTYRLDWNWQTPLDETWMRGRKWSGGRASKREFRRGGGFAVWASVEQDAKLRDVEAASVNVARFVLAAFAENYRDPTVAWSDGFARGVMDDIRKLMAKQKVLSDSLEYLVCDRTAARVMDACRSRHKRLVPIVGRRGLAAESERPATAGTLRLLDGTYYGRPITLTQDDFGRLGLQLEGLGTVFPEPVGAMPPDCETAAYGEMTRVGRRWAMRLVWVSAEDKSTKEIKKGRVT